jgi:hypothetical protein
VEHQAIPEQVRLVIDVRRGLDPIEGELIEPRALKRHFRGWLALAGLIESARADPDVHGSVRARSDGGPNAEDQGASPM